MYVKRKFYIPHVDTFIFINTQYITYNIFAFRDFSEKLVDGDVISSGVN